MPQHADAVALGGISGSTRDHTNAIVRSAATSEADLSSNETSLTLLYKLGVGSGTVLKDSGVHRLDGTISGASWGNLSYTPPA